MTDIKFQRGPQLKIDRTPIEDGTLSFATDTRKILLDTKNERIPLTGRDKDNVPLLDCSLVEVNKLEFFDIMPDPGTVGIGFVQNCSANIIDDKNIKAFFNGNEDGVEVKCSSDTTAKNLHMYSPFIIYVASPMLILFLGTIGSIDDGYIGG